MQWIERTKRLLPRALWRLVSRRREMKTRLSNLEIIVDLVVSDQLDSVQLEQAFNGQVHRRRIFGEILQSVPFDAVIETGTWLGDTTAYMRGASQLPVLSCEIDQRFFRCAQRRLLNEAGITLRNCDSIELLGSLSQSPLAGKTLFFYLDAHWYSNLPLRQELEMIASVWTDFVVMIDDFKVPWDQGYGFDTYQGRPLDTAMIADLVRIHDLTVLFPRLHSAEETGSARGCCVLASCGPVADSLESVGSLRANALWT